MRKGVSSIRMQTPFWGERDMGEEGREGEEWKGEREEEEEEEEEKKEEEKVWLCDKMREEIKFARTLSC